MMYVRLKFRSAPEGKIIVTIYVDGHELSESYLTGSLNETQSSLEQWQRAYLRLEGMALRLNLRPVSPAVSPNEIAAFAESLKLNFNEWLRTGDAKWQTARENLVRKLAETEDEICILIDVNEGDMRQFPWQDWDFLRDHCPNAEIALYNLNNHNRPHQGSGSSRVKVLVVVGKTDSIERGIEEDLEAIKELETQERGIIHILEQPSPHQVIDALRNQTYEIFIFTGHSGSDDHRNIGWIDLNDTDSLRLSDLKLALGKAISKRLQICIFNSCNGLGLAKQLAELKLPLSIVMQEPVPDLVAAKFLRVFLQNFSTGQSFFRSFHEAREGLEGFSGDYPGVCWLPTVSLCNPVEPPTWEQIGGTVATPNSWKRLLLLGLVVLPLLAVWFLKIRETKIKDVQPPQLSGEMWYGGSSSGQKLVTYIRRKLEQAFPDIKFIERISGTETSIKKINDKQIDFMFASEAVNTKIPTTLKVIAYDAIAVVVNPNLPVKSLTMEDLTNIITGKVTDWKNIPNSNVTSSIPIHVYYRNEGTTKFLTDTLVDQGDRDRAFKSNNFFELTDSHSRLTEAKNKVQNDSGGVYFVTASQSVDQCEFKPVPIIKESKKEPVAPYEGQLTPRDANCASVPEDNRNKVNIQAIKDHSYPLTRPIYLVLRDDNPAKQWGEYYLNVLQTDEGKEIILKAGFLPK
ncbi:MAG: substrate-binding domain-containing protein [Nostocales cyanobacterium ELA608]